MNGQNTSHVDSPEAFGKRLRRARTAAGMRQGDLAFKGCSVGYISRLEAGARVASLQVIRRLAARLGVSEQWLATGAEAVQLPGPEEALRDASIALRLDDLETAERLYGEALESPNPTIQAAGSAGLGQISYRRGKIQAAIERLERAFDLDSGLDDPSAAEILGRAYARAGEEEAAIALFRRWMQRAADADDPANRLRFAVMLANALIDNASFKEASRLLATTLEETQAGDPFALARVYWSQSRLHSMRGETVSASRYARRALELIESTEHTFLRAKAHQTLAFAELDAGNADTALELLERGRALLGDSGSPQDIAEFQLEQARALIQLGQLEQAAALAMETAGLLTEGHPFDAGRCYGELAAALAAAGESDRAEELYELAIEILERAPNRYIIDIYARYGGHLEEQGKRDQAFALYKRAAIARTALEHTVDHQAT